MMISHACIGLGGNTGDVAGTMQHALEALDLVDGVHVTAASSIYSTAPVGPDAGEDFLNAAACLETTCTAQRLLEHLKQVERALGRQPSDRWTSRRVDLDLLMLGTQVIETSRLSVPHRHMWYRRFVLDPLAEIAPDVQHPVFRISIIGLREALLERPLRLLVCGGCAEDRLAVGSLLRQHGIESLGEQDENNSQPLQIALPFEDYGAAPTFAGDARPAVTLSELPGTLLQAAESVVTAVLDEPRLQSRPLRRMP
jgi:2-amino-4-hydroxy-6-hydroxymethyldihydropteridine diphosphokinase